MDSFSTSLHYATASSRQYIYISGHPNNTANGILQPHKHVQRFRAGCPADASAWDKLLQTVCSPSPLLSVSKLTVLCTPRRQSETIFDNLKYYNVSGTWVATLNWRCDIYVYVSGAAPDDPRFREKGGVITVMVVHQGLLEFPPTQGTSERTDFVQKVLASTSLSSIKQFPATDSASQSGDNYQCAFLQHFRQTPYS